MCKAWSIMLSINTTFQKDECDWATTWPKHSNLNECQTIAISSLNFYRCLALKVTPTWASNSKDPNLCFIWHPRNFVLRCSYESHTRSFRGSRNSPPSPLRSKELCGNAEKVAIAQMSLKWPWKNGIPLPLQFGALIAKLSFLALPSRSSFHGTSHLPKDSIPTGQTALSASLEDVFSYNKQHRDVSHVGNHEVWVGAKGQIHINADEI